MIAGAGGGKGVRKAVVTCLGLGYLPVAPGTWGSLGACACALAVGWVAYGRAGFDVALGAMSAAAVLGCVVLGEWACQHYGSADPRAVVLDEAAGQWVALVGLPGAGAGAMLAVVGLQFLLFRAADVLKPPPARQAERLPGGWGIVCDDLVAGAYANLIGQIVFRYWWTLS